MKSEKGSVFLGGSERVSVSLLNGKQVKNYFKIIFAETKKSSTFAVPNEMRGDRKDKKGAAMPFKIRPKRDAAAREVL
ncbi:hypothetical protein [Sphingobacterium sp. LRF_L2]|uniref:hypothetical protein n=1 Tax=Sphingobacterium sp. LRF_L2 TaxID=3369421 RepID=UPI003F62FD9A